VSVATEEERIRAALSHVPANDRETWVQMGMAVKAEIGEGGFDLWDDWSSAAQSYKESDARAVWRSFKAGGITIASLFKKAIEHGYAESEPLKSIDPAERERRRVAREQEAKEAAACHGRTQAEAADKARDLWEKAGTVHADHAYVRAKKIKPYCAKQLREQLVVKIQDVDGAHHSAQYIQPAGSKTFQTGGRISGCFVAVTAGARPGGGTPLLIAEGFATACSLHEATGYPVAAAMNAGNLLNVARAWREKHPKLRIVICADDDTETAGNPGVTKATEAARAAGAALAVPDFGRERPDGASDFNDLHCLDGLEVVRRCVDAAASPEVTEGQLRNSSETPSVTVKPLPDKEGNRVTEERQVTAAETIRESDDQTIERLAALKPMEYDRVRKAEAKRMGIQVVTLDSAVAAARSEEGDADGPFADVEPWHEPVDGAALLDDLVSVVHRFIICDATTAHGTALWITMTWLMDSVDVAPIAAITAPEKRCGKSQLLFLMGRLSSRPLAASNITPAALFRAIEAWKPTLLIDEADAFMKENEELRGLLNCGHTRDSAYVVRTVGDDHMPKQFFVWGAKAIAGIGHLADTLMDRSIALELRRKLSHEQVDKLRHAEPGMFDRLRAKLARWSDDNEQAVRAARPALPDALHDRAADNWEPLFQIAEVAGGAWPDLAMRAALKLSGDSEQAQSNGAELLADIKEVFETQKAQRISMVDLLHALLADEERPWATWRGGRPMTPRSLGKMLGEYGIKSKAMKLGYEVHKGFEIDQFKDAFARYLSSPPVTPPSSVTRLPPNTGAGLKVTEGQLRNSGETPSVTVKPLSDKAGNRVTEENGKTGDAEESVTDDESEDL
jgi:putative DNA primase/helicase